jgi:ABC-2 type transport system permease protein
MIDWGRIWLIAKRELVTRFGQRSYRWTTIVQAVIIALVALAPVLIAKFGPDDSGESVDVLAVAVVDEADAGTVESLPVYMEAVSDGDAVEVSSAESVDAARQMVDDGDVNAALVVTRGEAGQLALTLINESGDAASVDAQRIISAASAVVMEGNIEESGLSSSDVQTIFSSPAITVTQVGDGGSDEADDGFDVVAYVISFLATILIFLAIVLYGQWIATGVVEEKSSRIMEIMVNAATPRDLLAGKVIGIMLAALGQFGPMLLIGGLIFAFQPQIADLMGVEVSEVLDIDFGAISLKAVGTFLVYFLLGFILYGSLYAGVGSLVSRQEEVSTAIAPMSMVMFLGYFAAITTLTDPDTTIARVAFLFPLTSPFVAVARVMIGEPTAGEIALSIGLLIIAVIGAIWLAGRLYRIGVLMYGQRPSFKSLWRLRGMQGVAR